MTEMKAGQIVHVEYASKDPPATKKFFEEVFGWKFQSQPMPPGASYWTFEAPAGPAGGLMETMEGRGPGTLTYLLVESVDEAVKRIASHGGKILRPKEEIPNVGWFAVFEAPGGVVQAAFESTRRM